AAAISRHYLGKASSDRACSTRIDCPGPVEKRMAATETLAVPGKQSERPQASGSILAEQLGSTTARSTNDAAAPPRDVRDLPAANDVSNYRKTALVVAAVLLACSCVAVYLVFRGTGWTPVVIGTLLALLLAAMPILVCHVQGTSRQRQLARLYSISDRPVSQTDYYAVARRAIQSIEPVALDRYY